MIVVVKEDMEVLVLVLVRCRSTVEGLRRVRFKCTIRKTSFDSSKKTFTLKYLASYSHEWNMIYSEIYIHYKCTSELTTELEFKP